MTPVLSDAQLERYSRQVLLAGVGGSGQRRLLDARVAVAGDGGAVATAVTLLARAGVGAIVLAGDAGPLPELSPDCTLTRATGLDAAPDVVVDLSGTRVLAGARTPTVV
ncbi:MAG TPA: ThiF family adenylyltransferase, partial [Candidatus Binatia bacterium]|nr:ThiF family adenylyltransferase [Candidatus Binatia bacterium]